MLIYWLILLTLTIKTMGIWRLELIEQNNDILIVGNGVLALSTAYALALEEPSLKIGIIAPVHRRGSATLAAGAMLNCFAEITKLTFKSKYASHKFTIAKEALKKWPSWIERLNAELSGDDRLMINPGTFVILNSTAGKREDQNYNAILEALNDYREPHEEMDPSEIPGIQPIDSFRPIKTVYLPNEGALSPKRLLAALEKVISKVGNVTFIDDVATEVLLSNDKAVGLKTEKKAVFYAPQILLAAGAYTQKLIDKIPRLNNRIPKIFASSGTSLTLKLNNHQIKHVIKTPVRTGSCGVHVLPCQEKAERLYLGATSSVRISPKTKPKTRDMYFLIGNAIEQFNHRIRDAEIVKYRVGNRPVTFDTLPLVGQTDSVSGLWILTGTYRDGLHDSPVLATSIANEILGRPSLSTNYFQPERFPIELMPKEEVIEELIDQYISAGYEHGLALPKMCWMSDVTQMARSLITSMYDQLEIDMGLPSDIFIMLHYVPELIPVFKRYYQTLKKEFPSYETRNKRSVVSI